MAKTGEPELICIDSDDDETPPTLATVPPGNRQSVSVLITGGQAIDVTRLRSTHLDQVVQPVPLPQFTYVRYPSTTGRMPARTSPYYQSTSLSNGRSGPVTHLPIPRNKSGPLELPNRVMPQILVANENIPVPNSLRHVQASTPNGTPPPPITLNFTSESRRSGDTLRKYEVTDDRAENYNFDAESTSLRANTRSSGTTSLCFRFKCTFGNCHRIIRGDVNFMFHLWAHVATSTEKTDLFTPKGMGMGRKNATESRSTTRLPGVEFACRCPECLVVFHTPVLMQIHYTKVHSLLKQAVTKHTCLICEKDLCNKTSLREHLEQHNPNDAPYQCRICNFRSTIRSNVLHHYMEKHRDTGNLMCPFCLWVSNVPQTYRCGNTWNITAPLVYNQQFVKHILDHATKKRIGCNNCATAIVGDSGDSQTRDPSIGAHRTAHNFDIGKHEYVRTVVKSKRGEAKTEMQIKRYNCIECSKQISSLIRQNEQCQECFKKSFWKRAYDRCGVKPGPSGSKYECECGLVTNIVEKIMYHYNDTKHSFKLVMDNSKTDEPCTKKLKIAEDDVGNVDLFVKDIEEAKVFAEHHEEHPLEEISKNMQKANYCRLVAEEDELLKTAKEVQTDGKESSMLNIITNMNKFLSLPHLKISDVPPMSSFKTHVRTSSTTTVRARPRRTRGSAHEEGRRRDHHQPVHSVSIMKPMQHKKNDGIANIEDLDDDDDDDIKSIPRRQAVMEDDSVERESSETRTDHDSNGPMTEQVKEDTPEFDAVVQMPLFEDGELFDVEDALLAIDGDEDDVGQIDVEKEAELLDSNPSSVEILTD